MHVLTRPDFNPCCTDEFLGLVSRISSPVKLRCYLLSAGVAACKSDLQPPREDWLTTDRLNVRCLDVHEAARLLISKTRRTFKMLDGY